MSPVVVARSLARAIAVDPGDAHSSPAASSIISRSGDIRESSALWEGTTRLPRILSRGHAISAAVSKTSPAAMLGRRLAALSGVASVSSWCPQEATFIPKRKDEGTC